MRGNCHQYSSFATSNDHEEFFGKSPRETTGTKKARAAAHSAPRGGCDFNCVWGARRGKVHLQAFSASSGEETTRHICTRRA